DGSHIWTALSDRDALACIEPSSGELTEINFADIPQISRQLPFQSMVYDGEKFWISGQRGGLVVRRDGGVLPHVQLPSCGRGSMLFDGSSVWVCSGNLLTRFNAKSLIQGASYS